MNIFIQNLIQTIRSLRTQGWQVAISSVSLAVGIVCLTFSADWFWAETNYDSFRPDYRNLYIMQTYKDSLHSKVGHMNPDTELLEMERQTQDGSYRMGMIAHVDVLSDIVLMAHYPLAYKVEGDDNEHILHSIAMDTCAAELLGVRILHGSLVDALATPPHDDVVITDKAAMRLFGKTDAVGMTFQHVGTQIIYTVKAVCAAEEGASNFRYDVIRSLSDRRYTHFSSKNFRCLIHTSDPDHVTERLNLYQKAGEEQRVRSLTPLRTCPKMYPDSALHEKLEKTSFVDIFFYPMVFTIISLLLIISAVTNLIMVYTSICLARVREYALRRSMGASTWQNVQWILTGIIPALLFGGLLSGVAMEWITKFVDIPWDTAYVFHCYTIVLLGTLLLCLIGMAYPVHKMRCAYRASFLGHGDGGRSHLWLLIVQCVACAFLLFISIGMQRQTYGMINVDLGYDHKNMLRLYTGVVRPEGFTRYYNLSGFDKYAKEFAKEAGAGIVDVIGMNTDIFNRITRSVVSVYDETIFPNRHEMDPQALNSAVHKIDYVEIPFRAMEFFNIRTANGQKLLEQDERADEMQAILNPEAMRLLTPDGTVKTDYYMGEMEYTQSAFIFRNNKRHWENKRINIKDVTNLRAEDCFTKVAPTMYVGVEEYHECATINYDAIYIKYAEGRREEAEAAVRKVLASFDVPEDQYLLTTLDEHIEGVYKKETFIANLLTYLTVFSVVITLAGVFSMLLYSLRLRRRSMAIHRVMGATFKDIFMPTLRPYLIYAVLGAVAAYFPAYILMRKWMEYFHYGETPGVGLMLSILGGMVLIITLIVWWQVSLCMKEKPVEILKPES